MSAEPKGPTESKKGRIVARGLSHAFDAPVRGRGDGNRLSLVLEGVDLEVRVGEFFCIVGGSGCGKTTLLRILAGLLRPGGRGGEHGRSPG